MSFIVAPNIVASRPPEHRPTGTTRANDSLKALTSYQQRFLFFFLVNAILNIGMSGQCCNHYQYPFRQSTGNEVNGHYFCHYFLFWHERAAFQRSAFERSTAGNDVVATMIISLFLFLSPHFSNFSPSRPFFLEGVLRSKNLFSESCLECPKTQGQTLFQIPSAILGPPGGHFGFCRRCGIAGGERVPPQSLGWYSILHLNLFP